MALKVSLGRRAVGPLLPERVPPGGQDPASAASPPVAGAAPGSPGASDPGSSKALSND